MSDREEAIAQYNDAYGRGEELVFAAGPGDLGCAHIRNEQGAARVCLQGAHVLSFIPAGGQDLLWLSSASRYRPGVAIRGGIPVCWPWFGPHPEDPSLPAHGFARNRLWEPVESFVDRSGATVLRLALGSDAETLKLWPHDFRLELEVRVSERLLVEMRAYNTGERPFRYTGALHTYLRVGDVSDSMVTGLEGESYLDKLDDMRRQRQDGAVAVDREIDRIFLNTSRDCVLHDGASGRRIRVAKNGSRSTVVWNPWRDKAESMPDFDTDGWQRMVCIEAANAEDDQVEVGPGRDALLATTLSTESGG